MCLLCLCGEKKIPLVCVYKSALGELFNMSFPKGTNAAVIDGFSTNILCLMILIGNDYSQSFSLIPQKHCKILQYLSSFLKKLPHSPQYQLSFSNFNCQLLIINCQLTKKTVLFTNIHRKSCSRIRNSCS